MAVDIAHTTELTDGGKWAPDALYDIGLQKWKQQQADIEGLDRKAFNLFAVSSGVLAAGTAVLRLQERVPQISLWIAGAGLALFVITAFFIYRATRIATFAMGPDPELTIRHADRYSDPELKHWAGRSFLDSFRTNKPLLDGKATMVKWAQVATAVETGLIAIALLTSFIVTP